MNKQTQEETIQSERVENDSTKLTINDKSTNNKGAKKKKDNRTLDYVRPHRCDIRLEEFYAGTWKTFNPSISFSLLSTYIKCLRSEIGQEPNTPLQYISDDAYSIYSKVYERGNVRENFFENTEAKLARQNSSQPSQSSSLPTLNRNLGVNSNK